MPQSFSWARRVWEKNMFEHRERRIRAAALAVAVLFLLTACAAVGEADARSDKIAGLVMFTDESLSYVPEINISEGATTISAEGSALAGYGFKWTGGPMHTANLTKEAGHDRPAANPVSVLLTADWTEEVSGLTQTATQTIYFYIYDAPRIDGVQDYITGMTIGTDTAKGTIVETLSYTSDADTTVEHSVTITGPDGASSDAFGLNTATGEITVAADTLEVGNYHVRDIVTSTGSGEHAASRHSVATADVTIVVSDQFEITNTKTTYTTYIGNSDLGPSTIPISTNLESVANIDHTRGVTYTIGGYSTTNVDRSYFTISGNHIVFDPEDYVMADQDGSTDIIMDTFSFDVTATVYDTSGEAVSATKTFTMNVWKAIEFTTAPSIDNITGTAVSGDQKFLKLSFDAPGATTVRFDWGDGSPVDVVDTSAASGQVTQYHVFSSYDSYDIYIEASNSVGTAKEHFLYTASAGGSGNGGSGDGDWSVGGIVEEHGWLFIVFAALAVILVALFYALFPWPVTIIGAAASAVLAIVSYLLGWGV